MPPLGWHVAVSLAIAWPACVTVCLSPVMGWNCIDSGTESCIAYLPVSYVILIAIIFAMAVVIVIFANVRIFIVLKRLFSNAKTPENPEENLPMARRRELEEQYRQLQKSLKMQVTVAIVAAMFVIVWLPICIGSVQQVLCIAREDCEIEARPYWGMFIALCSSVINPVIYAFRIKKIREAVHHRARRLASAVREKLGWSSNQMVIIQVVGDSRTMEPSSNSDNPTDQPTKWAVSRRAAENPTNAQSSRRLDDST
ncbi:adenosine receptor A2a-like [Branchiostoma floridae]|uniref:Adenosine receptor A2a-like n=1 Tax=Branchiostoma floridae TaxID=7739 RepID=A0A9J7HUK5_BRAFL|nr:adenosine receptor A2a-like [Branchiostoma floridae]